MKRFVDVSLALLIGGAAGVGFHYAKSFSHDHFTAEWECGVVQQSTPSLTDRCNYDDLRDEWVLSDNGKTVRKFRHVSW